MGRLEKVNQQIKREISMILQRDLADPRLIFVSITSVDVSKDLRHARVYFSALGGAKKMEDSQNALDSARGAIRRLVGQRLQLRNVPDFTFTQDFSLEYSARVEETLKEIKDELEPNDRGDQET